MIQAGDRFDKWLSLSVETLTPASFAHQGPTNYMHPSEGPLAFLLALDFHGNYSEPDPVCRRLLSIMV